MFAFDAHRFYRRAHEAGNKEAVCIDARMLRTFAAQLAAPGAEDRPNDRKAVYGAVEQADPLQRGGQRTAVTAVDRVVVPVVAVLVAVDNPVAAGGLRRRFAGRRARGDGVHGRPGGLACARSRGRLAGRPRRDARSIVPGALARERPSANATRTSERAAITASPA